jgi:nitrilase
MLPEYLREHPEINMQTDEMCRGGSAVISPMGEIIAGPLYGEEGILITDLKMDEIKRAKLDFDVVGHYARPDVFHFDVIVP